MAGVWHADALGSAALRTQATGYAALDAQLPGGGWPLGGLSEVLQAPASLQAWQLVLPALGQATGNRPGVVVVVAPPGEPFAPALHGRGLPAHRVCWIRSETAACAAAAHLWATEQALRCTGVLAVLAWLPQAQAASLRRLQLAAATHQQLLWVFRPASAAPQASPAVLRLQVQPGPLPGGAGMRVQILKRRGPPLAQPLDLPDCHPRLSRVLAAQAARRRAGPGGVGQTGASGPARAVPAGEWPRQEGAHGLDRAAMAAG